MLWWFLLTFFASTIDDILVVFYLRRVRDDIIPSAILYSMSIGFVQLLAMNFFIVDRIYGLANILGNGLGTGIAMWLERKRRV